jgi:dTDP-4-amino-4,6-dideoxygalactose transaminase
MIPISRPQLGAPEEEAVIRVLRSGRLAQGPEVESFEREFAPVAGSAHAVACANGTAALQLALLAHDIGPGDEVIVPSLTFAASGNAVLACGARPVFCDVLEEDFCIDVADAERRVTPATKAIMPVHLYGQMADMDAVMDLAGARGIVVIEDACQAHGASFDGRRAGSFSTAAFSLYATKNITTGEGGMVTTNDAAVDERLRLLRNHGMPERYVHTTFGLNLRMTEIEAAMGRAQLTRLDEWNARRRENAAFYDAELAGIPGLTLPRELPGRSHIWHQYTVRVEGRRDRVLQRMRDAGVGAEVYYPIPAHLQRSFASGDSLPVSELLTSEVMSIPVHPGLDEGERATVAKALVDAMMETA